MWRTFGYGSSLFSTWKATKLRPDLSLLVYFGGWGYQWICLSEVGKCWDVTPISRVIPNCKVPLPLGRPGPLTLPTSARLQWKRSQGHPVLSAWPEKKVNFTSKTWRFCQKNCRNLRICQGISGFRRVKIGIQPAQTVDQHKKKGTWPPRIGHERANHEDIAGHSHQNIGQPSVSTKRWWLDRKKWGRRDMAEWKMMVSSSRDPVHRMVLYRYMGNWSIKNGDFRTETRDTKQKYPLKSINSHLCVSCGTPIPSNNQMIRLGTWISFVLGGLNDKGWWKKHLCVM